MKKLSFQKVFNFLSILFLGTCCLFYGARFLKLFIANTKEQIIEKDSIVKKIKESNENNDYFKKIEENYYFIGQPDNNYISYSNIIWRIIRVNEDNSFTAISDNSLTELAFGKDLKYKDSMIYKWLNKTEAEYSGILEKALNNPGKYLMKTKACLDTVDNITNNPCKDVDDSNYLSLLSTVDFANIGNKNSFVINDEFFYLNNLNSKNEIWQITDEGKVTVTSGTDIIGIKPVITIKPNVDYVSGDGTIKDPYVIDGDNGLFGSYVKLGNDTWRIYEVDGDQIRLMLNDYLKVGENNLSYNYSKSSSYHNDTVNGTLAYYLNHDYYDSLPYKDLITEKKWPNGYYNASNNFDYETALNKEVDTRIATLSIGNIFLNPELDNYFTMTGTTDNGNIMYTIQKNKKLYSKSVQAKLNVIPAITLDKNVLKKGNGTINNPYETEA